MTIAAIIIITLRLISPFLILRFPITGVAICSLVDFYDFNVIGGLEHYQLIDKTLDLIYLSFCVYIALGWKDVIARQLAIGLFIYRLIGVFVLFLTGQEWTLILFPNIFEMFFVFYILYVRLARTYRLFWSWASTIPLLISISIPKLAQEYSLHIQLAHPDLAPEFFVALIQSSKILTTLLWFGIPAVALWWYVRRSTKQINTPQ